MSLECTTHPAHKAVTTPQVVWICHPHHPLVGQAVAVVRPYKAAGKTEPRWLIHHPDLGTVSLPQAWTQASPLSSLTPLPSPMPPSLPGADVHSLLKLAMLVAALAAQPAQLTQEDAHAADSAPFHPAPPLAKPAGRPQSPPLPSDGPSALPTSGRHPSCIGEQP